MPGRLTKARRWRGGRRDGRLRFAFARRLFRLGAGHRIGSNGVEKIEGELQEPMHGWRV